MNLKILSLCAFSAVNCAVLADDAAEFKDYTLRKLQGGGVLEAFDNPLFEKPDVPGMRAGDPEKEWLQHCGYNGSGGLRLIPTSDKQVKHDFNCKIKSLVPGKKYVLIRRCPHRRQSLLPHLLVEQRQGQLVSEENRAHRRMGASRGLRLRAARQER